MDIWPGKVTAITLFVDDMAAAKSFYREAFGLRMQFENEISVVVDFGNTIIYLLALSEAPGLVGPAEVGGGDVGVRAQFTITVDDVDAVCAVLARRGVSLLDGPMDRPWRIRTAAFRDPSGHVREVAS
jgi:lactoylglutathione lyase